MAYRKIIKRRVRDVTPAVVFILSLLIIVISAVCIYFFIKDNNEQLERLREAKENTEKRKTELEEIENKILLVSRLTGWRHERGWLEPKGGWTDKDALAKSLNKWLVFLKDVYGITKYEEWKETEGEGKEPKKEKLNIIKLITELENRTAANNKATEEVKPPRDRARQEETSLTGSLDKEGRVKNPGAIFNKETEKIGEITPLREQILQLDSRIKELINDKERTVSQATIQLWEKSANLVNLIKQNEAEITQMEQELAEYQDRWEKIKQRLELEKEGIEIDGEVIVADVGNGYAYINLGRQHGLLVEGMDFEVFGIEKGGLKRPKGRIKIVKIYENYSQAIIIPETMDPDNLIAKGDYVNSIMYNPKKSKIFALAGRPIGRYSAAELKQRIEKAGGTVPDEIPPDISYVVIGEGFQTDPKYIKADHLGAITIREKELYFFLGLEWK